VAASKCGMIRQVLIIVTKGCVKLTEHIMLQVLETR
jgi:hypothetical protein